MMFVRCIDKSVPYDQFVCDVAAKLAQYLHEDKADPEFISQRKAYAMFKRRNVERWRSLGKATPYKRPNRIEYRTAELRMLQRTEQDYLGQ